MRRNILSLLVAFRYTMFHPDSYRDKPLLRAKTLRDIFMDTLRFQNKNYRSKYVCFACRKAFKRLADPQPIPSRTIKCSECGNDAVLSGAKFRAPKKESENEWEMLEILYILNPPNHFFVPFSNLYSIQYKFELPSGRTALKKKLVENKLYLQKNIDMLVRRYSDDNREVIKSLSDRIALINAYLNKKRPHNRT